LVARDVEIDGTTVPAGSQVALLLGAGNRDPRHYEAPDAFLVERNPVDHLSFGYGPHGCAGQGLARLEAHAVIEALVSRVQRLVVGEEARVPSNITRSIEALPVLEVVPA
jgi:cytochrome P450